MKSLKLTERDRIVLWRNLLEIQRLGYMFIDWQGQSMLWSQNQKGIRLLKILLKSHLFLLSSRPPGRVSCCHPSPPILPSVPSVSPCCARTLHILVNKYLTQVYTPTRWLDPQGQMPSLIYLYIPSAPHTGGIP